MATRSSVLAWRIPWTEEPGGLQSMGSERVRRGWSEGASFPSISLVVRPFKIYGLCSLGGETV